MIPCSIVKSLAPLAAIVHLDLSSTRIEHHVLFLPSVAVLICQSTHIENQMR